MRPFPNAQIVVQVRYKSGAGAPQGMMVALESEQGGIVTQGQTDSLGKVVFRPTQRGVYVVTVSEPGYGEAKYRVDLTVTPTSFVTVELQPLPKEGPPAPPGGPAAKIAARDLSIPEAARKEFEAGAKLLMKDRNTQSSIPHLRKAIELHEAFPQAYLMLGMAYLEQEKWENATSALEKAVQLDPSSAAAHIALGASLSQQKNYLAAEKALSRGLELNPEAAEGHYELGKAYWALGRWQEAEPHARKALALQPAYPAAHLLLGNVLLREREAASALSEFKEYLRLEPNGPFASPTREIVAKIEKVLAASH